MSQQTTNKDLNSVDLKQDFVSKHSNIKEQDACIDNKAGCYGMENCEKVKLNKNISTSPDNKTHKTTSDNEQNTNNKRCIQISGLKSLPVVLVLLGGMITHFLTTGILRSHGMVNLEFLDLFEVGSASSSWIAFTLNIIIATLGPVSGIICDKLDQSLMMIVFGLVGTAGLIGTAFCTSIFQVIFTYGLLVGLSYRFAWSASVVFINRHFNRNLCILSNGFMFTGSSLGGIILPFLITWFSSVFSSRGAMLLMGAVWLHLVPAGMLLSKKLLVNTPYINSQIKEEQTIVITTVNAPEKNVKSTHKEMTYIPNAEMKSERKILGVFFETLAGLRSLFTLKYLTTLCLFLGVTTGMTAVPQYLPFYAKENGFSKTQAATLLSIVYVFDLFSRILLTLIGDWRRVNRDLLLGCMLTVVGSLALVLSFYSTTAMFYIYAIAQGSLGDSAIVFLGYTIEKNVPTEHMGLGIGFITCLYGVSGMSAAAIVGHVQEYTQTYVSFLYLTGSLQILGAIIYLLGRRKCLTRSFKQTKRLHT